MEVCPVMISKPQSFVYRDHVCTGKTTELVLASWSKAQDKEHGKNPSPKAKRKYFPLFQKQGPVAGDPAAAGRCLQRELAQKKANIKKAVASAGTGDR